MDNAKASHTPRTDAALMKPSTVSTYRLYSTVTGAPVGFVSASFARQLERENADLLAALEGMVETFKGYQGMELSQARAAIKKAKGHE